MSLRARLLVATLALVAAGLTVAGFATYGFLRDFLVSRVDQQLSAAAQPLAQALAHPGGFDRDRGPAVSEFYGELRGANGARLPGSFTPCLYCKRPGPQLPDSLPQLTSMPADGSPKRFDTRGHTGVGGRYRALAVPVNGGFFVAAAPLNEVDRTLSRLVLVELAVSAGVLLAVALAAFWLVRLGLRPLDRISATAGAIAGGDLSRRVEEGPPRTEVGRLAASLNAMLAQIEAAFAERRRSEERLRRFIADASHELRTPLTSIRGYAELFRAGARSRPDDLDKAMRRIEQEAGRMGVMVDDLLLLARLDQGRPLERQPVDLAAIAADAVADAQAVEPDRPLALDAPEHLVVTGDDLRLRQVVSNLLANVRTHTPPETRARVRLSRDDGAAVLEVADEGPGLPPEDRERVWERFFRADPARVRTSGGSGLGLSIVAAIVESHGGAVEVESAAGRGATFRVRLPLPERAAAAPAVTPASAPS